MSAKKSNQKNNFERTLHSREFHCSWTRTSSNCVHHHALREPIIPFQQPSLMVADLAIANAVWHILIVPRFCRQAFIAGEWIVKEGVFPSSHPSIVQVESTVSGKGYVTLCKFDWSFARDARGWRIISIPYWPVCALCSGVCCVRIQRSGSHVQATVQTNYWHGKVCSGGCREHDCAGTT